MKNPFVKRFSEAIDALKGNTEAEEEIIVVNDIPNTICIDYLKGMISPLVNEITATELKQETRRLAEEIKYSDPVSNDLVKGLEESLMDMAGEFMKLVYENDTEKPLAKCKEIRSALKMRNSLVKQGK